MIHQILMFLAPDNAATQGLTQATLRTPPAYPSQATAPGPVAAPSQLETGKICGFIARKCCWIGSVSCRMLAMSAIHASRVIASTVSGRFIILKD